MQGSNDEAAFLEHTGISSMQVFLLSSGTLDSFSLLILCKLEYVNYSWMAHVTLESRDSLSFDVHFQ